MKKYLWAAVIAAAAAMALAASASADVIRVSITSPQYQGTIVEGILHEPVYATRGESQIITRGDGSITKVGWTTYVATLSGDTVTNHFAYTQSHDGTIVGEYWHATTCNGGEVIDAGVWDPPNTFIGRWDTPNVALESHDPLIQTFFLARSLGCG